MPRNDGFLGGCLKLLILPIAVSIIAGLVVLAVQVMSQKKPALTIASSKGVLTITNNTDQVLFIRVAYRNVTPTGSGYCYPNPSKAMGGQDPQLWPGDTQSYPPKTCGSGLNGYAVWAWNNRDELVFQMEG